MLIEYTIRFEKNGLTIVQRVEPSASTSQVTGEQLAEKDLLRASHQESETANTTEPKQGGNGLTGHIGGDRKEAFDPGTKAPVTFIGPFIMYCRCDDSKKENEE